MKCWGKESDFFRKASRPRRWQTHVPKPCLNAVLISSFCYAKERGAEGDWGRAVMVDLRHLDISEGLRRTSCPWLVDSNHFIDMDLAMLHLLSPLQSDRHSWATFLIFWAEAGFR